MEFVAMNRKVNIDLEPGLYDFNPTSATGKTLLVKMVKSLGDKEKIAITYNDILLGVNLQNVAVNLNPKLIILDRFDMYDDNSDILYQLKDCGAIVLVDYKTQRSFCDFDDTCFVTMSNNCLEVSL